MTTPKKAATRRTIGELEEALAASIGRIAELEKTVQKLSTARPQHAARVAREAARDEIAKRAPTTEESNREAVEKRRLERRKVRQVEGYPWSTPAAQGHDPFREAYQEYRRSLIPTIRARWPGRAFLEDEPATQQKIELLLNTEEFAYREPRDMAEAVERDEARYQRELKASRSEAEKEELPPGTFRDPFGILRDDRGRRVPSPEGQARINAENERFGQAMREGTAEIHARIFDPVELQRMRDAGEISKKPQPRKPDYRREAPSTLDDAIEAARKRRAAIEKRIADSRKAEAEKPEKKVGLDALSDDDREFLEDARAKGAEIMEKIDLTPAEHQRMRRERRAAMKADLRAAQREKIAASQST
jgi:hypothetical protein